MKKIIGFLVLITSLVKLVVLGYGFYLFIGGSLMVSIFTLFRIILHRYRCFKCNGSGTLNEYDSILDCKLENTKCYVCGGKGHTFMSKLDHLNKIGKIALEAINQIEQEIGKVKVQIHNLEVTARVTVATPMAAIITRNEALLKRYQQLDLLKQRLKAYEAVLSYVVISLHSLDIILIAQKHIKSVEEWDTIQFDTLFMDTVFMRDVKCADKTNWSMCCFSAEYETLLSSELIDDIESARLEIIKLIN